MSHRHIAPRSFSRRAALQGTTGVGFGALALGAPSWASARQSAAPAATPGADAEPGATGERVAQATDALDALVEELMAETDVPGLAVSVVFNDEVVLARGYGVTSTESGAPVDADTIFQLASVSKPIASTVVASIVGEGLATWDTPIVELMPEFALHDAWVTSQVTIRDMFSHRSGLPEHAGDLLEDIGYDRDEVLHRLRYQEPASSFRSTYAYTNFGLTAAAVAASRTTGASWEDASAERLYQPAGMTRTSSRFDDFTDDANHASTHMQVDGAWVPAYVRQPDAQSPAGGVSSTVTDLAQWMRLHLNGGSLDGTQVIPDSALDETHRPQIINRQAGDPALERASFYGLGWNVGYDDRGTVQISHSGAFALGAGTTVFLRPAEEIGIVVLTNAAPIGLAEAVALSFLEIARTGSLVIDYLAALQPIFADIAAPQYGTAVLPELAPPQPEPALDLDVYTGTYANDLYGAATVAIDGDRLTLSLGPDADPGVYALDHWNRDTFTYLPLGENGNVTSAVTFTIGADGDALRVTVENLDIHGQGTLTRDLAG